MSILDGHKDFTDPQPFQLTCDKVMEIIRKKIANPGQIIPGQSEALFHIETCEECKKYLKDSNNQALSL